MRSGREPFAAGQKAVGIARMGSSDRQTLEHVVRDRGRRAQARRHPASDVDQRDRLPVWLRRQGDAEVETKTGAVIHRADDDLSAVSSAASPLKRSQFRDPRAL